MHLRTLTYRGLLAERPKHLLSPLRAKPFCASSTLKARQWSTPLAKSLAEAISTTGPIPIAQFMRLCLNSDRGGYYIDRSVSLGDQFGKSGDFITSPEISQVFGELIGIWFVSEWISQGKPSRGVQLVELGPGRGTLLADVLRFGSFASAIESIVLVEASPALREAQRQRLSESTELRRTSHGFEADGKHLPRTKITWYEDMTLMPRGQNVMPFIVAHEFFDAMPIHAFQHVRNADVELDPSKHSSQAKGMGEWRELLVSPTAPPSILDHRKTPGPEFELTLSQTSTRYSEYLPHLSPRYEALRRVKSATIEVSPEGQNIAARLAEYVGGTMQKTGERFKSKPSGAALLIDYGPADTVPISTLRGIREHELCSPFDTPGLVDISADVDFGALAEAALKASPDIEVHGPVEQGDWLQSMGGKERSEALLSQTKDTDLRERLDSGWQRLVSKGPNGMGKLYKFMSVVPLSNGRRPVGFGGGVGL